MIDFVEASKNEIEVRVHHHKKSEQLGWFDAKTTEDRIDKDVKKMIQADRHFHKSSAIQNINHVRFIVKTFGGEDARFSEIMLKKVIDFIAEDKTQFVIVSIEAIEQVKTRLKNRISESKNDIDGYIQLGERVFNESQKLVNRGFKRDDEYQKQVKVMIEENSSGQDDVLARLAIGILDNIQKLIARAFEDDSVIEKVYRDRVDNVLKAFYSQEKECGS